jgi:hypothetical protein
MWCFENGQHCACELIVYPAHPPICAADMASDMLALVNQARRSEGARPLRYSNELQDAALRHSRDIARTGNQGHVGEHSSFVACADPIDCRWPHYFAGSNSNCTCTTHATVWFDSARPPQLLTQHLQKATVLSWSSRQCLVQDGDGVLPLLSSAVAHTRLYIGNIVTALTPPVVFVLAAGMRFLSM